MPSTFKYRCFLCKAEFEKFYHSAHYDKAGINRENIENPIKCSNQDCNGGNFVNVTGTQFCRSFTVSESHKPGMTTRTDQFMANAEMNRIKKLNERFKEKKEQAFYNGDSDKKTLKAKDKEIKVINAEHKNKIESN